MMWLSQVSSQWRSKTTTCVTTQHKSKAVSILSIFMDLIEDLEDCMSLLASRLIAFLVFLKLYKYLIRQRKTYHYFWRQKTHSVADYCVWSILLWWIYLRFKFCDSFSTCVNEALEGPHCRVCTHFNCQWTIWIVAINDLDCFQWYVLVPVESIFLIAERVRLL